MPQSLRLVVALVAAGLLASSAGAQSWGTVDTEGYGGAGAYVCPVDDAGTGDFLCLRLECSDAEPLHFSLDVAGGGGVGATLPVTVSVDGRAAGALTFTPGGGDDYLHLTAPFDARLDPALVARLRAGNRAELTLGWSTGSFTVPMGLAGSGATLGAVMERCPVPQAPVGDPAAEVLGEVTEACRGLGGTVALEPGFERREDLDGDGREDVVIDYAAAVCSEMASLYCGSGGCTVGFFLARDDGFTRIFADVIRGYEVLPGGRLALSLHGSACGLYGFEDCRRVFDITGDAPVLVEELGGPAAEAAQAGAAGAAAEAAPTGATATMIPTGGTPQASGGAAATINPLAEAGAATGAGGAGTMIPMADVAVPGGAAEDTPAEDAPAEDAPAEDAPAEKVPAAAGPAGVASTLIPTGDTGSATAIPAEKPREIPTEGAAENFTEPALPADLVANPTYRGGAAAGAGLPGGGDTATRLPAAGGGIATGGVAGPSPRHDARPGSGGAVEAAGGDTGNAGASRREETAQE